MSTASYFREVLALFPRSIGTHYKAVRVMEQNVFYREAGSQSAPAILLLHGFPTSSNMFRNLILRLATSFHVIAPDYPGFGLSSMPDHKSFSYTFENLTNVVEGLLRHLDWANIPCMSWTMVHRSGIASRYGSLIGCRC
jgi:pimeloyl-ACP methyl ester carboxylesterase